MPSEDDLLAQWAGEELFAAGRAGDGLQKIHRERGHFYRDALRQLREHPCSLGETPPPIEHPVAHLLALAFSPTA